MRSTELMMLKVPIVLAKPRLGKFTLGSLWQKTK